MRSQCKQISCRAISARLRALSAARRITAVCGARAASALMRPATIFESLIVQTLRRPFSKLALKVHQTDTAVSLKNELVDLTSIWIKLFFSN